MANVYTGGYTIPKAPKLATVAAQPDPFGLSSKTAGLFGLPNNGNTGSSSAAAQGYSTVGQAQTGQAGSVNVPKAPSVNPGGLSQQVGVQATTTPTATTPTWDPNQDPAYAAVYALTGLNDEQAKAAAQKQIRDQLLAYGDPNLSRSVLGDSALAQAAAQNPTSTTAQLKNQYTQGLGDLDEQLNQQNLGYSGYRVKQDKQAGLNYQNALAQAAAAVNSALDQINGNLSGTLNQNALQRAQALFQAEQAAAALGAGTGGGAGGGGAGGDASATAKAAANSTGANALAPAAGYALSQGDLDAARQRALRGQYL